MRPAVRPKWLRSSAWTVPRQSHGESHDARAGYCGGDSGGTLPVHVTLFNLASSTPLEWDEQPALLREIQT